MLYNSQILGIVISRERIKRGMTQEQLSGLTGTSRSHLAALESGKKIMKIDTLCRIADALGMKPAELVSLMDEEYEKSQ